MSLLDRLKHVFRTLRGAVAPGTRGNREKVMSSYAGRWFTSFGPMDLTQNGDRVEGSYTYAGNRCAIAGRVEGGRLSFTYHEPAVTGEGWFEQRRHGKFAGQWRPSGETRWFPWEGSRDFDGIWDTTFGPLRLVQEADRVLGFYEGLGRSSLEGRIDGSRLTFRYQEPQVGGEGWFELDASGESFNGSWRPDGGGPWGPWQGRRVHAIPGYVWLVVVEAPWQRGLAERDYSFGSMLAEFFARLPHVGVRQRFFDNEQGLQRWLRDVTYLAEPVAVVLAAHGTERGLMSHGEPMDPRGLVESLRFADNIVLLHFSACLMMQEGQAGELARTLQREASFPISGYNTIVDWAASALLEFHYLDMVLGRGLSPEEAARQLPQLVGYAGETAPPGSPYRAAGFRLFMPRAAASAGASNFK